MINYRLVANKCPWCGQEETWEHVILCKGIMPLKHKHIGELRNTIKKLKGVEYLKGFNRVDVARHWASHNPGWRMSKCSNSKLN